MENNLRSSFSIFRNIVASSISAGLISVLLLSAMPRWHELIHRDANAPGHECAVTLATSGSYQKPAPLVAVAVPVLQFCFVPALHPVWVASPFVNARLLEHAPPLLA
ncbi:MAG TPA: hypothetical protein VGH00_08065 [Chthoniobacterales bacterium]